MQCWHCMHVVLLAKQEARCHAPLETLVELPTHPSISSSEALSTSTLDCTRDCCGRGLGLGRPHELHSALQERMNAQAGKEPRCPSDLAGLRQMGGPYPAPVRFL